MYRRITGTTCAYCGVRADTEDHVFPASAMFDVLRNGAYEVESLLVPCCKECNSLAGASVHATFNLKLDYIRQQLRERYKRVLAAEDFNALEVIYESDKAIIEKVEMLRERERVFSRLAHRHPYDFARPVVNLDFERICPICQLTLRYKSATRRDGLEGKPCAECNSLLDLKKRCMDANITMPTQCDCRCERCSAAINHTSISTCANKLLAGESARCAQCIAWDVAAIRRAKSM